MSIKHQSFCENAKKCGGCQLQNMDYQHQLEFKQATVVRLLGKFGYVEKIIGMKNPFHYRNKVQAAFGLTRSKKIISGVYQSSSHRIVNVTDCMLEDKKADEVIVAIRDLLPEFRILPYNEESKKGLLRHVLVKHSLNTNQLMVVLVGANSFFAQKHNFVKKLVSLYPEITTVVFNINSQNTSMVLGEREEVLYGKGYIEDILCGLRFRISPKSFYQINAFQTETLYKTALDFAGLTKNDVVLDTYCGTGTIGLTASSFAKQIVGVEINGDAVKDAKTNAKINNISNARFFKADAGEFMSDVAKEGERVDVVFMDPPRAGSNKKFLESLILLSPSRVVYISCNPETQKRDLIMLTKGGYKVRKIQPVDMFPHTAHVETVVLLTKVQN